MLNVMQQIIHLETFKHRAVDGRNPANQLRLLVYPAVFKVLYIPRG